MVNSFSGIDAFDGSGDHVLQREREPEWFGSARI
jgi:hypothetical protein